VEILVKNNLERIDWKKEIASRDPAEAKKWQVKEYRRCVDDKTYWFNNYVWTIDTRRDPSIIPFILYPKQTELIKQLDKYQDLFVDKPHDLGISWTTMGWELHQCCYTKGFTALNISRKESEVQDSGNTFHALHGRLLFMYQRLPPFLKPRIHNPFLIFAVPGMNSVIKGESANPRAGRDTQYKFVFIDEAAFIECLDEMWKGVRNASNTVFLNSTPPTESVNNKFAEIKDMPNSGFVKISFNWKDNPQHDQAWFDKKTAAMTEQEIAQEVLVGYDKAKTNRSYPEYDDGIHLLGHKVYLNPKSKLYCFMDFGLDGEGWIFSQKDFEDRLFCIYYKLFVNKLTPELYSEFIKSLDAIRYTGEIKEITFIGDKSGNKRSRLTKTSVIDDWKTVSGGQIDIKSRELSNDEKMKCVKTCFKRYIHGRPQFNISNDLTCLELAKCIKNVTLDKSGADHVDNKYTHAVNMIEYGINYLFPKTKAAGVVVGVDPGQEIQEEDGNTRIIETVIHRGASVASIIGDRRIERKGIFQ
jgi:hypothetical protein